MSEPHDTTRDAPHDTSARGDGGSMRDLTKSAARLSWSLFVYGAQRLADRGRREAADGGGRGRRRGVDAARPARPARPARSEAERAETERSFRERADHLAEEAHEELESDFRSLYDLGERAGERMIDIGFDLMDPRRAVDRAASVMGRVADLANGREREGDGRAADDEVASA